MLQGPTICYNKWKDFHLNLDKMLTFVLKLSSLYTKKKEPEMWQYTVTVMAPVLIQWSQLHFWYRMVSMFLMLASSFPLQPQSTWEILSLISVL
jgi:hypothetical protein